MINSVGKTTAIIRLNDFTINMVNSTISSDINTGINILDEDNQTIRYTMSIDNDGIGSRCLMFTRSLSGDPIDSILRPVIYIPPVVDTTNERATCIPLYECISPSLAMLVNGNYQLTWWTNYDYEPDIDDLGRYQYDYAKIHKFKTNALGDVEGDTSVYKMLCTAPIYWEKLRMGNYDDRPYNTPVVRNIAILACIQGEGYIVDFSTGGGGGGEGGAKIHNHLNNQECGFAGAVFMPSAMPRIISWK